MSISLNRFELLKWDVLCNHKDNLQSFFKKRSMNEYFMLSCIKGDYNMINLLINHSNGHVYNPESLIRTLIVCFNKNNDKDKYFECISTIIKKAKFSVSCEEIINNIIDSIEEVYIDQYTKLLYLFLYINDDRTFLIGVLESIILKKIKYSQIHDAIISLIPISEYSLDNHDKIYELIDRSYLHTELYNIPYKLVMNGFTDPKHYVLYYSINKKEYKCLGSIISTGIYNTEILMKLSVHSYNTEKTEESIKLSNDYTENDNELKTVMNLFIPTYTSILTSSILNNINLDKIFDVIISSKIGDTYSLADTVLNFMHTLQLHVDLNSEHNRIIINKYIKHKKIYVLLKKIGIQIKQDTDDKCYTCNLDDCNVTLICGHKYHLKCISTNRIIKNYCTLCGHIILL